MLKMVNDKDGNPTLDVLVNGVKVRLHVNPELLRQTGYSIEDIAAGTEKMTADLLKHTGNSGQPLSPEELELITLHSEAKRLGVAVEHLEIGDDGKVYNAHELEKTQEAAEAARPGFFSSLWSTVKGAYNSLLGKDHDYVFGDYSQAFNQRREVKLSEAIKDLGHAFFRNVKTAAAYSPLALIAAVPLLSGGCGPVAYQSVDLDAQPLDGSPVLANPGVYSNSPGTFLLASNSDSEEWGELIFSLNLNLKDREETTVLETGDNSERESTTGAGFGITYLGRFTDDRQLAARILFSNARDGTIKDNGIESGSYERKQHLYGISFQDRLGNDSGGFVYLLGVSSVGDEVTSKDNPIGTLTFPERIDTRIGTIYHIEVGGEGETSNVDVRGAFVWKGNYDNDRDDNIQTLGGKVTAQFAAGEAYAAVLSERTDESQRHPGIDPHSRTLIELGGMGDFCGSSGFGSSTDRTGGLNGYILLDLSGVSRVGGAGFGGYWLFGSDQGILKLNITYKANQFKDSDERIEREGTCLDLYVGFAF
jgi:hypothetical protein